MSDALLVLHAGSSSLKFSVFLNQDLPQPVVRGQIEGLTAQPRFVARNDSAVISQKNGRRKYEFVLYFKGTVNGLKK